MRHAIVATAMCLAVSLPTQVRAQGVSDAIPKEAVLAILRNFSGPGEPEILVGNRLPASLATRVSVPPGARIIVTLLGPTTQVIGITSGIPDSVRAWFAADFERRGYRPAQSWYGSDAFRPAAQSAVNRPYCGDGLELTASASRRQPGMVEFVLRSSVTWTCSRRPPAQYVGNGGGSSGNNPPDLPLLFHPATAEMSARCNGPSGYGNSQRSTSSSISTGMSAEQLLKHYGRQLDSAGWKRESESGGLTAAWTKRDSTGRDVRLALSIASGNGADCRNLSMTATDFRP